MFTRLSLTVLAAVAAAIGISLSVFLLPGAGVQGGATPLLRASSDSGRVAANLPVTAGNRAGKPTPKVRSFAQPVAVPTEQFVAQVRRAAPSAHGAHRRVPARAVAGARSPVPVTPPASPATPVKTIAGAPAPPARGHGKALGHSKEHHNGLPPGQAKKALTAPPAVPGSPPKGNGDGNGHKGGKK